MLFLNSCILYLLLIGYVSMVVNVDIEDIYLFR